MAKARWRWWSFVNMDLASSAARWMLSSSVEVGELFHSVSNAMD